MKSIKSVLILMVLCCCIPLAGQDYQQIPEGIKVTINSVDVELQFYTPSIVRILKISQWVEVYEGESFCSRNSSESEDFRYSGRQYYKLEK